jgi:hypothetical protein
MAAAACGALALGTLLVPRTGRAQGAASYRAPRMPDGTPDLQGIWQVLNSAAWDIQDHAAHLGEPAGQGIVDGNEIPYQPWALARKEKNARNPSADADAKCFFPGVPRIMYIAHPFQIFQTPTYTEILFEYGHHTRLIYTDGSPHHEEIPFWMGDSRGRWDGETFVIDTTNFNDEPTWLDKAGNFHSDALHVVERLTRTDADHMQWEATIEDSKVFTRPWKMRMTLYRRVEPNAQLLEYECYGLSVYEGHRYDKDIKRAAAKKNAKPAAGAAPAPPKPK